jgi:transcriptional regulator with XRE-family HTH domain
MTDDMTKQIGERLRLARTRTRMTKRAACEAIGISESTLYQWEQGSYMPPLDKAAMLCKAYGVTVSDVVGDNEEDHSRMARLEARLDELERGK